MTATILGIGSEVLTTLPARGVSTGGGDLVMFRVEGTRSVNKDREQERENSENYPQQGA
jgi:hypothetical protein